MATLTRGERFKDARTVYNQHGNQTMDEVAAAIGVSKSLIQSLEDDEVTRSVGYDKVAKLAEHYGVRSDFLLGLTNDHSLVPCAVDDLELSNEAVSVIERMQMCDIPDGQIMFGTASKHAVDIMNSLLESADFKYLFGNLLLCFDSFMTGENSTEPNTDDCELEYELRKGGRVVLSAADAGKFYASEAANALKNFANTEIPKLVQSCLKSK